MHSFTFYIKKFLPVGKVAWRLYEFEWSTFTTQHEQQSSLFIKMEGIQM
jgi:hypothetical protein